MAVVARGGAGDLDQAMALILELAEFERARAEVDVDPAKMRDWFNEGLFEILVAREGLEVVGIAIYYSAYSTWKGKIIYLDDLIVTASYRRKGIGKQLFDALIVRCVELKANQLRWHVLDWNQPAIDFYKRYAAGLDPEWVTGKLNRHQLTALANG